MGKIYIVADGKSISTREGVIGEGKPVKEELLNGNVDALLKAKIIRESEENKEETKKDIDKNDENGEIKNKETDKKAGASKK